MSSLFSYPEGNADDRSRRRKGLILTSIETTSSCSPAHDGGNGTDDSSHPRVGDAHPLHGCVTTRVQENVEGSQGPGERVYSQRQQGDSRDPAGGSEADGEQGAAGREQRHALRKRVCLKGSLLPLSFRLLPKTKIGFFVIFDSPSPNVPTLRQAVLKN